jgi:hypothetical protein
MGVPLTDARMEFISFCGAAAQTMPVISSSIAICIFINFDIGGFIRFYLHRIQDNINCKMCKCK